MQIQVATAGEALIDLIAGADGRYEPCLGGAVFNLTRAVTRQGVGATYLNPLSSDRFGRQLARALEQDGVLLARPQPVVEVTSLAVVSVSAAGHPDYAFYRQGVADRAVTAEGLNQACAQHAALELVYTGALALSADDAGVYLPWLRQQRALGKTVVVDANLRPSVMPDLVAYRRNVMDAVQCADIVKASDEDLEILQIPGADAVESARHLLGASGARLLALTLGEQGACLLSREGGAWRAAEAGPVTVVDTVGAGDCFLAGLLAALLRSERRRGALLEGLDDEVARHLLSHALASATLCVMRRGAVPPSWDEVRNRVALAPCLFA